MTRKLHIQYPGAMLLLALALYPFALLKVAKAETFGLDALQLQYLEQELSDRGLSDVVVSSTGCLKVCEEGPAMVVYPENWWYGRIESESSIDDIIDALEEGRQADAYTLT